MLDIPLFAAYPNLHTRVARVPLGELPTPLEELADLARELGIGRLLVKRDDLSGRVYGGNKVRKLEFLLAAAQARGATEVLTFGCAGSNHATATAVYANELGMASINMLLPQANAHSVRRNLLLSYSVGAELHHYDDGDRVSAGVRAQLDACRARGGSEPYVIPAGGSSGLGALGFVNAAFELRDQLAVHGIPPPECVYVAGGTVGTAAGLILGLCAAGVDTRVVTVRVTSEKYASALRVAELATESAGLLHAVDASFPAVAPRAGEVAMRHDFFGEEYARYTPASVEAVRVFHAHGIKLEGTYTGKAAAALIADARHGKLRDRTVVFWNTYNSRDFSERIAGIDYRHLPPAFHRYFEEDVQPLDRGC